MGDPSSSVLPESYSATVNPRPVDGTRARSGLASHDASRKVVVEIRCPDCGGRFGTAWRDRTGNAFVRINTWSLPPDGSIVFTMRTEETPIPVPEKPNRLAFISLRCDRPTCQYSTGAPFAVLSYRLLRELDTARPDPKGRRPWRWVPDPEDCMTPLLPTVERTEDQRALAMRHAFVESQRWWSALS